MDQTPEKSCQNERIQDFPEKINSEKTEEDKKLDENQDIKDFEDNSEDNLLDDDVDDILNEFSTHEVISSDHPLSPQGEEKSSESESQPELTHLTKTTQLDSDLKDNSKPDDEINPLSITNENEKELELMTDINRLQNELKSAASKVNTLQQQLQVMHKYKQISDSYLAVSEGASDPKIWFENVMKIEKESFLRVSQKNSEMTKKIEKLEKERNDSVVKNAKIEKSILDAKKVADNSTREMKKAKASEDKAKQEAERCRRMSNQAIKEHATMKEQYTTNINKLKWTENKLQNETDDLALEKDKNAKLARELKQAKEETTQIRANTQQIIQTYQNSEEVKSNALNTELSQLQVQYESVKIERDKFESELNLKTEQLELIRTDLVDADAKVQCLEVERNQLIEERNTMASTLNSQKNDLTEMGSKLAVCQKLLDETESARSALQDEADAATERADDRCAQAVTLQQRESELLNSVSTLTTLNTELNGRVKMLETRLGDYEIMKTECGQNRRELQSRNEEYQTLAKESREEIDTLKVSLSEIQVEFENSSNRLKALEKQNATLKKELRAALQSVNQGGISMPRSQSINSIDSMGEAGIHSGNGSTSGGPPHSPLRTNVANTPTHSPKFDRNRGRKSEVESSGGSGLNGMEKKDIIHKLVQVQKQYVKRNEKIDFLSDHVAQLTEELKKENETNSIIYATGATW